MRGTVKWFNAVRGYGFIGGEDGTDYFVHFTQIRMEGFKKLRAGQAVEFAPDNDENGRPAAASVCVLEE